MAEKNNIMKQNYLKKLMTALLLLCCTVVSAQVFEVDGIYYNILSEEDKTVEVTSGSNKYIGAVTIPASVTYNSTTYGVISIGDMAFTYCTGLTSIEIPASVTSIGKYAFLDCDGLTSIEIPAGVTSISDYAFYNCDGLTSINIPEGVTSISDYAFYNCDGLTSINIPEGVTSIGDWAFRGCTGLTSINIPASVTSIGKYAFYNCDGLTSIEIPASVTSIGEYAFYGCTSLTSIEIPSSVTSIGNSAFYNCYGLTSIEIPSSVTSIGERAFYYCYGLTSIVVDEGNSVYDSRGNCNAIIETASNTLIAGCVNTIIPEGVTSIGESAFEGCNILTIEIPASVTSIGIGAFWSCYSLTSINIPAGVTSIGYGAFRGCTGLTSIVVGDGNSVYDSRGNCNAIIETASNTLILGCKNTIIPEGVTSIGEYAFYGCSSLTSIVIPEGVTSIGESAFYYCYGLTSITSHIAAENLFAPGNDAFRIIDKNACTLYVPAGAKSTYAATEQWKEFTNIVEMSPAGYSLTVSAAGYATMYLDKAVEIPAGVEAYTANRIEGDRLKMQAVEDVIPANTAVIIKAEEGNYSFAHSDETPDAIEGNLLRGTLTDTYIKPAGAQTAYVLSVVDGIVGMYRAKLKADGTFKNNANRVYMLLGEINVGEGDLDTSSPGGQLSNGYRFDFSGTTAIESVETESAAPAVYCDLSGRRVENPAKGIYIVNGRKVFIK